MKCKTKLAMRGIGSLRAKTQYWYICGGGSNK